MLLHVVRNVVSLAIGIVRARGSAERIWGDFFILVWRILGKLSAKFSANFHSEIFAQIFQTVVSPGFQATGWHPKQSRPKFTLKLVGIPLQFHIFGPKNVSRRLSADGRPMLSEMLLLTLIVLPSSLFWLSMLLLVLLELRMSLLSFLVVVIWDVVISLLSHCC